MKKLVAILVFTYFMAVFFPAIAQAAVRQPCSAQETIKPAKLDSDRNASEHGKVRRQQPPQKIDEKKQGNKPGDDKKPPQKIDEKKPGNKPGDDKKPPQKIDEKKPGNKPGDDKKPPQKIDEKKPGNKPGNDKKPQEKPEHPKSAGLITEIMRTVS